MNIIFNVANNYNNLINKEYRFKISHKKREHDIILDFYPEYFFHIVGLQYLKDIDFDKDRKVVFSKILNGIITDILLIKSSFYHVVEENYVNVKSRIAAFEKIEILH